MLKKGAPDTKSKIMEAAFELFGRYGIEGTSIRDISAKSGVNLAAINYHFKNKENLYWEIITHTYLDLEKEVQGFALESTTVVELAMRTYDYFIREKYVLRNVMKMMLAEGIGQPESESAKAVVNSPMGPPGGMIFAERIQKEVGRTLTREQMMWGVKSIFGAVTHWAMMCCASHFEEGIKDDPLMSPAQVRKDVEAMVVASMQYLRSST